MKTVFFIGVALLSSASAATAQSYCNQKISLKSFKNDYLHRDGTGNGISAHDSGVGNHWTIECIDGGKIRLLSFKGDYLHRDGTGNGISAHDSGAGNHWIIENTENGIKLQSFKGDYLHRNGKDDAPNISAHDSGVGNLWTVEYIR